MNGYKMLNSSSGFPALYFHVIMCDFPFIWILRYWFILTVANHFQNLLLHSRLWNLSEAGISFTNLIYETCVLQGVLRDLLKVSAEGIEYHTAKVSEQVAPFKELLIQESFLELIYNVFFYFFFTFLFSHCWGDLQSESAANNSDVVPSANDIINASNGDNSAATAGQ